MNHPIVEMSSYHLINICRILFTKDQLDSYFDGSKTAILSEFTLGSGKNIFCRKNKYNKPKN